jgi:transposase-like protein
MNKKPFPMPKPDSFNLSTIAKFTSTEAEAYRFMETLRWPDGQPVCPHCGVKNNSTYLEPRNGGRKTRSGKISERRVWKCKDCRKQFTAIVGTVFERSHIPLQKWLLGMYMMFTAKNGVSAHELSRALEITIKAAWFMGHRLRFAMEEEDGEPMTGIVEADETWIGGRIRGKGKGIGVYAENKTPVMTLISRQGKARSQALERVTRETLGNVLAANVSRDAILMTDQHKGYVVPGREFADHQAVDHGRDEFVRGIAHTNTAEGFFSQLKRSIDGTHHQVSKQHLPRYLAEFDYKYNHREMTDSQRMAKAVRKSAGKRLMYRRIVSN